MQDKQAQQTYTQMQLVQSALSGNNRVASRAISKLRELDLLEGDEGALQGLNFRGADLRHVDLRNANLRGVDLSNARLNQVRFWYANLEKANFSGVSIPSAELVGVDLRQAHLQNANLTRANLEYSDLRGANLCNADLRAVNFWQSSLSQTIFTGARFNQQTIMPDGQKWHPKMDIRCYTHENHPKAWRPADYDLAQLWDLMNSRYRKNKNIKNQYANLLFPNATD